MTGNAVVRGSPPVRLALLALGCAAAGWLAIWLPWWRAAGAGTTKADNPIDGMQAVTLVVLPILGLVVGALAPRIGWRAALATTAALPVIAFVEMARDPSSHNLWPMEFVVYGVLALFTAGPAFVAGRVRLRLGGDRGRARAV